MRRVKIGIVGITLFVAAGCLHASVLWSPDGQWLAYTLATRAEPPDLAAGWLFDTAVASPRRLLSRSTVHTDSQRMYRLWASRAEDGESVLLDESQGPLTSPCWSGDGRALAYGRLVPEAEGRARFEVVVMEAPERKRIVLTRPINEFNARATELPGLTVAWSPDGRYLAIPIIQQTLSLGIIRADNGRVLKVIEDAYLPSWSPDGAKLAFVQGGEAESLQYVDHNFGAPRHLAVIGQSSQAPVWARDSRSLAIVARRVAPLNRREPPSQQTDLMRVHIESGKPELITTVHSEAGDREKTYHGTSFSFDRDGTEVFHASAVEGKPSVIIRYQPRTRETLETFHPIDHTIGIGALAVSPDGKSLAFRVGSSGDLSTPAVVDLDTKQVMPLVPDDAARVEWLSALIRTARDILRSSLPARDAENRPIERPTLLPVPGEMAANSEVLIRLRRLGRIGRPLCDRPASAPPASDRLLDILAEARLFFDFLGKDYNAALTSIDALEPRLTTSDQRLRLLGVRAQIFLALNQADQAGKTIAFLRTIAARTGRHFEETPIGPELTGEVGPAQRWAGYLSDRAAAMAQAASGSTPDVPLGRHNPGIPNPIVEPFPGPAAAPLPFAPLIQVVPPFIPRPREFEFEVRVGADQNQPIFVPPRPGPALRPQRRAGEFP